VECRCVVGEGWQEEDGISISEMIGRLKTFSFSYERSSSFCLSIFFFFSFLGKIVRVQFIDDVKAVKKMENRLYLLIK